VLEVVSLEGAELDAACAGEADGSGSRWRRSSRAATSAEAQRRARETLVELLQAKVRELEQGTGSVSQDEWILSGGAGGGTASNLMKACVKYRLGQKRAAIEWLRIAEALL